MDDKILFDRDVDNNPDIDTNKIAFGTGTDFSKNMSFASLFTLIKNWLLDASRGFVTKTGNADGWTPVDDNDLANKKYVDDSMQAAANYIAIPFGNKVDNTFGSIVERNRIINFTGRFDDNGLGDGDTVFTIPSEITAPKIDIYIPCGNHSGGGSVRIKIAANTRIAFAENQDASSGATMSFIGTYLI